VPGGAESLGQITKIDPETDFAILQVNGLQLPALSFTRDYPKVGEVVWWGVRWTREDGSIGLAKGSLRNTYNLVEKTSPS